MTNLMISGFKRLLKNRAFQITAAVVAVVGLFEIFMMYRDSIIEMETPYFDSGLFAFAGVGMFAIATVVSLFVGSEYSDGTIRNKVVVGHHREVQGGHELREGLIPQAVLRHPVGDLEHRCRLPLRQPLHGVDGGLFVGRGEGKFVSDHGKPLLSMVKSKP